ncbi:glycosyltransferase [Pelosinus baikalensis]|uniref:Glycosyltransferase n=1 Tax=Pelosinus baikalensis TaxID=2892015 RepID=A0ABS8HMG0_9FIRM|nr:glycosyltransferase [Pelosinus baikalensis]
MKILHIGEYIKGGVATYIRMLLEFQSCHDKIDTVDLILSRNHSETKWSLSDNHIFYYEYERKVVYIFKAIFQIYKHIRTIDPDIIHVHSTWSGVFVRILYFLSYRRPKIVYCAHGWSFLMEISNFKKKIYASIERLLAYKTDAIINISQYEHNYAIKYGIPASKCVMIYNGIQKTNYNESKKQNFQINEDKINILFVGRFDRQKGLDILLDTFAEYKLDNIELYLIGDSVLNKHKISIPNSVHQLGWVDNSIIDEYYSMCDVVIIPSRWEGFGLVAVEAMKNKKAVIASNRGALPEIVLDNYNGYIIDIHKRDELYSLLINLDKVKLKKMGENGYALYKQKFTDEILNKQILELYMRLLD